MYTVVKIFVSYYQYVSYNNNNNNTPSSNACLTHMSMHALQIGVLGQGLESEVCFE